VNEAEKMEKHKSSERSIKEIREIMERSSTFISLSGLSGVLSGLLALAGVFYLYGIFGSLFVSGPEIDRIGNESQVSAQIYLTFSGIFILALAGALILSYTKAKSKGVKLFKGSSKRFAFNFFIPIITAAFVILAMIRNGEFWLIMPVSLIFYGMALVSSGKYARKEVSDLGTGCILSGVLSLYFVEFSILLWGIGFGVLNMLTGIAMYYRYEKHANDPEKDA
jgi:hypothetical protein